MKNLLHLPKAEDVTEVPMLDMDLKIVTVTEENLPAILDAILEMYKGEPCRICGQPIDDPRKSVFTGYSADSASRCAHQTCWNANIPKSQWAYPVDDAD